MYLNRMCFNNNVRNKDCSRYATKVYRGREGTAVRIIDLSTRLALSFTLQPFYPRRKSCRYATDGIFYWHRCLFTRKEIFHCQEEKNEFQECSQLFYLKLRTSI
jgi:hypothetical protein